MTDEATQDPVGAVHEPPTSPPQGQNQASLDIVGTTETAPAAQIAADSASPSEGASPPANSIPSPLEGEGKGEGVVPPAQDPRDAKIADLEAQLSQQTAAHAEAAAAHRSALAAAQQRAGAEVSAANAALSEAKGQLANAATRYKMAVLEHSPEIPRELVEGKTIEEVEASLEKARGVVAKVKDLLAQQAAASVPAGAPVRQGPDIESLSPLDKIKYSLAHRKK